MRRSSIPILMYHEVAAGHFGAFRKYVVGPDMFRRHMTVLERLGYRPIGMDHLVESRREGATIPARAVVITFDDGFAGVIEHAVPVLRSHGFSATFYLVSDLVGRRSAWLRHERGLDLPLFDWPAARELVNQRFVIGSHTATHPHLPRLADEELRSELERSRETIASAIGQPVVHLAYPFGEYDDRVVRVTAQTGYRTSTSVRPGLSAMLDDPLALHRVPVNGGYTLVDFVSAVITGRPPAQIALAARRRLVRMLRRLV